MKIIIQKFGGTSVATEQNRSMVADKVIDSIKKEYSPVVVVSAIGRAGDPYSTDTLLSLINNNNIDMEVENREIDLLMCCGEIISAVVLSDTFTKRGYKTRVLTGGNAGIITDDNYGNANIIDVGTENILAILEQGIIPIITGFQGITEKGDLTTLGRGGSDVTGAVLGDALNAEYIEIYTDVDGIMTADPRIVPNAKVISNISFNEVFQFADQGAKVIHPRAVEYAMNGNVPLIIKNTLSDAPGTTISTSRKKSNNTITGITHIANRTQITIFFTDCENNENNSIFELIGNNNICIELINVFRDQKIFTIDGNDQAKVDEILNNSHVNYRTINNCSKIAVIGNRLIEVPGIMAKILKTLDENKIPVLQTADSNTTVWCLVMENDTIRAINALHNAFCLEK